MSKPLRFKPVNPAHEMVFSPQGCWVAWGDYQEVQAEVERLTAFTTRTIIPNDELQKQVERLTKAGDAMVDMVDWEVPYERRKKLEAEWLAAKEGKPRA
jgi:hypothetical protein